MPGLPSNASFNQSLVLFPVARMWCPKFVVGSTAATWNDGAFSLTASHSALSACVLLAA